MQVSLRGRVDFAVECYAAAPDDLSVRLPEQPDGVIVQRLEVEADEAWSFVGKKANPQWLWLALDTRTRQVIAFYIGDRSRKSARKLWEKILAVYRNQLYYGDTILNSNDLKMVTLPLSDDINIVSPEPNPHRARPRMRLASPTAAVGG